MKKIFTSACVIAICVINFAFTKCNDTQCAYEKKDKHTGTTVHYDKYGNELGKTKP